MSVKTTKKPTEKAKPKPTAKKSLSYIESIDRLIPGAYKEAREMANAFGKTVETRPGNDGLRNHWFVDEFFHKTMNEKAHKMGLRMML